MQNDYYRITWAQVYGCMYACAHALACLCACTHSRCAYVYNYDPISEKRLKMFLNVKNKRKMKVFPQNIWQFRK